MEEIWQRIETWLQNEENVPKGEILLNPGATEEEIQQTETTLGIRFPKDFRTFLKIHDGEPWASRGVMEGWRFLALKEIVEDWSIWKKLLDAGTFDKNEGDSDPGVRNAWWNPGWISIATNDCGDGYCLDMAPTPEGQEGQIILMWHDMSDRTLEAPNFRAWMEYLAEGMESGDVYYCEDEEAIVRADPLEEGEEA